ncbi:mechanosensitive ion channel family protein [Desulfonatronovibrio hydrogenovorans]|uniref:mechanosensitive ion channel family protein n=1 Tax=Desulfonatronovibrio hydrogenovorans TaxID=53245 RepID=UPI00048B7B8F|nr:mechanosensitive ion channel family protein [Desulfonatronovibrio hydrogenovorans]
MDMLQQIIQEIGWESIIPTTLRVLVILFIVYLIKKVVRSALERLEGRLVQRGKTTGEPPSEVQKRSETLIKLLRQGIYAAIWVLALLVLLRQLGFEIAPILAGAGIIGLAVGFGAQNLVRDVISGFFIILEDQIRVGDVAVINGTGGLVEKVNFRTIVLRDLTGTVHVFPNGTINTLSNMTNTWSAYIFDLGVAYKEDTDKVVELIKKVGESLKTDEYFGPLMVDNLEVFGVDKFADSAVMIRGRIKTRPIKQWEVGREFLRRIKKTFDENRIEIPFPHRSVYFGSASKPMDIKLLENSSGLSPGSGPADSRG